MRVKDLDLKPVQRDFDLYVVSCRISSISKGVS